MKVLLNVNTDGALYRFRKPIIKALVQKGVQVVTASPKSIYFEDIKKLGAKPLEVNYSRRGIGLFSNFKTILQLIQLLKKEKPDVLHSFTHKAVIFGAVASLFSYVPKVVVTITGLGTVFSSGGVKNALLKSIVLAQYKFVSYFVDTFFFQNPDDMEYFNRLGVVPKSKSILTNGSSIDLSEFDKVKNEERIYFRMQLSEELNMQLKDKKVVIFTARGVKEKGFFEYYNASKLLSALFPEEYVFIHLGLMDEGVAKDLNGNFEEYAKECNVTYLGFKENVRDYLIGSDIMVLPSSYREGTPRSLIEALAVGMPIVTTQTPGCKETVIHSWNGFFMEPYSTNSLISCILRIDEDFLNKAKVNSRELCESKYDSKFLIELTLRAYEK